MDLSRFTDLMDKAFLEFRIKQTRQRLSVSLNSFASFLDFSPPIVNQWLNGSRLPTETNVERMIPKLVELLDLEVYDILGIPRPDTYFQQISEIWPNLSMEHRKSLTELAEKYMKGKEPDAPVNQPPLPLKELVEHGFTGENPPQVDSVTAVETKLEESKQGGDTTSAPDAAQPPTPTPNSPPTETPPTT
jgi:transcriptional regulator with XRE-family HTH domain